MIINEVCLHSFTRGERRDREEEEKGRRVERRIDRGARKERNLRKFVLYENKD